MKSSDSKLPKWPMKFLRWFCDPELLEDVEGDLAELYEQNEMKFGSEKANRKLRQDVLLLFRPGMIRPISTEIFDLLMNYTMFKHNLLISWRHLLKNKGFSALNIGGLAIGMAVTLLIGLWIWDAVSFNKYHTNYDSIARVMQNQTFATGVETWSSQAKQLGPALKEGYSNHFEAICMSSWSYNATLKYEETILTRVGICMEPVAPEMLSLRMIHGNWEDLADISSMFVSASTAEAIWGDENPVGKVLNIDNEDNLKVVGVFEDLPESSSFHGLEFMATWEYHLTNRPDWLEWGNSWFQAFVQLKDGNDLQNVSEIIKSVKMDHVAEESSARFKPEIFLHPMSKWYLYGDFENGVNVGGRIEYIRMYGIIGLFVLLLACINFMNLSTARSEKRAREVGVRKTVGSKRIQLINQFFSESILIAIFAFFSSLIISQLLLPIFGEISGREISIPWTNISFWIVSFIVVGIIGLLAGSYPALYLSSFQPVKVLKGTLQVGRNAIAPRKALVVVQFTVSIVLIIGTMIVYQQIQYVKDRPIGYNYNRLVSVPIKNGEIRQKFMALKDDLMKTGQIEGVAKSENRISSTYTTNSGLSWKGKAPDMQDEFVSLRITHDFGKVIGWEIVEGRDFSREFTTDSMGFVVNEAAVKYMDMENPIGEIIDWGDNDKYTIIGVVKNMITQSPYSPTRPMIFFIDYDRTTIANIKLKPEAVTADAIAQIQHVFETYDPVNPFEYEFVDEAYARKFRGNERVGKLASLFAILAIFISCLGLFGMATYVAEQRTKEIGIRKVLGASASNLWLMLSKDFIILVLLSCLIASPIAFYFLSNWLEDYTYHVDISVWVFIFAGLGAIIITLITVSFQSIKAALANPVKSLRAE